MLNELNCCKELFISDSPFKRTLETGLQVPILIANCSILLDVLIYFCICIVYVDDMVGDDGSEGARVTLRWYHFRSLHVYAWINYYLREHYER